MKRDIRRLQEYTKGDSMKLTRLQIFGLSLTRAAGAALVVSTLAVPTLNSQNPELQARLAEVKESMARNKQELAHYSWMEQDIISLKGEEKKEELFQVQLGPDGKPQKTNLDPDSMSDDERRRRGLRGRIIEDRRIQGIRRRNEEPHATVRSAQQRTPGPGLPGRQGHVRARRSSK